MKKKLIVCMLLALLVVPLSAFAGAPLESVKGRVNEVLDVLRDHSFKGASGEKAKKAKIRAISEKMFNYNELSRRTLARNWRKFSLEQQKEFIELYKSILEDAYVDKIISYTDEKVVFKKEIPLSDKTAEVQTTIVTKKADIPINYRVILSTSPGHVGSQ